MEQTQETTQQTPGVVRNYKDTVFRMLFRDREKLLELYNAMNGTHYTNSEELRIVTLENAIYMSMKNDLAFLVGTQIHLYEQQSTVTPNMPYRFLQYVTKEFEKLIDTREIYGSKLLKLPAPQFVVFYNGQESYPEEQILKLSDAYGDAKGEPQLELTVRVLNINMGDNQSQYNKELLEQCRTLREYMQYVETVRRYAKEMEVREAVKFAVDKCIQEGILREFLLQNKAEVEAMSIFEYDEEGVMKIIRRQEREIGWEEGHKQGLNAGLKEKEEDLIKRVCIKLQKSKAQNQIADELEEPLEKIQTICEAALRCKTPFDVDEIYQIMQGTQINT